MARQPNKSDKPNILVIWGDDIGIETFKESPPAQRPGTCTVDDALSKMHEVPSGD